MGSSHDCTPYYKSMGHFLNVVWVFLAFHKVLTIVSYLGRRVRWTEDEVRGTREGEGKGEYQHESWRVTRLFYSSPTFVSLCKLKDTFRQWWLCAQPNELHTSFFLMLHPDIPPFTRGMLLGLSITQFIRVNHIARLI